MNVPIFPETNWAEAVKLIGFYITVYFVAGMVITERWPRDRKK